jgi:hypothetical protein
VDGEASGGDDAGTDPGDDVLPGDDGGTGAEDAADDPGTPGDDAAADEGVDTGPPPVHDWVYAHSSSELYQVDPETLEISLVGPFGWPSGGDSMTDIALDRDGYMVGISFNTVYAVNRFSAECTYLSSLDRSFNGLSFLPDEEDPDAPEVLIAAGLDGTLYRLDPATGASSTFGTYGGSYTSSGDLVSVRDFGTVATVKNGSSATDWLVRVDPDTGTATPIGDTGVTDVWGLGFWAGEVYGFTASGQFVLIDVTTGAAAEVSTESVSWWGAGVTTSAPNVPL